MQIIEIANSIPSEPVLRLFNLLLNIFTVGHNARTKSEHKRKEETDLSHFLDGEGRTMFLLMYYVKNQDYHLSDQQNMTSKSNTTAEFRSFGTNDEHMFKQVQISKSTHTS